ncbi:hypothetical protein [uncultured Robinsoniella sp.]|uniref:hypothetical protein n=1 Tax=uncultured Robinsoniella sp. TaxID=904190 RepID=UPI00374F2522
MKAIVNEREFKRIIDNTKRFICPSVHTSIMMEYIRLKIDIEAGEIEATALDNYRIADEYAELIQADGSFTCYIKPNIPKLTGIDRVEIELSGDRAYVVAGDSIAGYLQPAKEYPNADAFLKKELERKSKAHVYVNAKYLLDAIQQIPAHERIQKPVISLDVAGPQEPIIIRHGKKNVKLVLPAIVNI